ncbi:MAG: LysM peptidoglycan-binding domain-containing protein [Saprospiraceae bacterium]|nr:LysM peptidoglycan-binding domain-containing protein [Saprospiraceae bacterium]
MKHLPLLLLFALFLPACATFRTKKTTESAPDVTPRTAMSSATGNVMLDYVSKYKDPAISEMQRAGIPASITLAQGILESASGQSDLASTANNHFGIKCGGGWTGKTYHKKDDDYDASGKLTESCFRKYNNPDESFFDHSEFLRDPRKSNRYGFLFNLDKRDYKNWARGLQSSGYATSQTYADQLIDLIERLRLYEYDQPGAVDVKPGGVIPATVPPQSRIGRVNDVKVVNSRQGETIADIARVYDINAEKIADYNDRGYPPGQALFTGTRIFIQCKRDSWHGQATHHFVRDRQTMFEIAQQYGIKLDKLLQRNGMQDGQEPAANEKIRLRGKRSSSETVRLRSTADDPANPSPATPTATPPGSMTPDDTVILDMGNNSTTPNTKPTDTSMPGKPATTGVPYPPDPVPGTTTPPVVSPGNPSTGPSTVPPTTTTAPPGYHFVVKGDTLYNISRKYNLTVARLKQLNGMTDDNIKLGQTLRVQ